MVFLVMIRIYRLGEERGVGGWGCIVFFLYKERLIEFGGEGYSFYIVGYWMFGILRLRKFFGFILGFFMIYVKICYGREERFLFVEFFFFVGDE